MNNYSRILFMLLTLSAAISADCGYIKGKDWYIEADSGCYYKAFSGQTYSWNWPNPGQEIDFANDFINEHQDMMEVVGLRGQKTQIDYSNLHSEYYMKVASAMLLYFTQSDRYFSGVGRGILLHKIDSSLLVDGGPMNAYGDYKNLVLHNSIRGGYWAKEYRGSAIVLVVKAWR